MKKLSIIFLLFICYNNLLLAQTFPFKRVGSKDCFNAPTLCNNDVIIDELGVRAVPFKGAVDDVPSSYPSCFKPKSEANPFWYRFIASNSGSFEMYLNAKQEGVDFDFIVFDVTTGCTTKSVVVCNSSQLDLDSNRIGTGVSSDSMNLYQPDFPDDQNSWVKSFNLVQGKTYAVYIESRSLQSNDSSFAITFGGNAQFKNVISAFTYSSTVCFGKPVTFTNNSTGGATYQWDFGDGTNSSVVNPTHNYTAPGTYTVILKAFSSSGCVDIYSTTVSVNVAFNPFAGNDAEICSGTSTTLTATGGVSYSWSPPTGLSSTSGASPIANPIATTTYKVIATDASGCTGTDDVTISVDPLPPVNAGNNVTICNGQSTTLGASGAITYTWSPASGLSAVNIANPIASPSVTTTYTVTGTDAKGCKGTSTVTITVNASPTINAGPDATICNGLSTNLNGTGAIAYAWSPAMGLSATNIANPVANPGSTTIYVLTGTDIKGCTGTDTMSVNVNPLPNVSAGSNFTLCSGLSTTLNATGATIYSWSPATGLSATNISNPVANPAATTTYSVTGTDVLGCINSATLTITVNPKPNVSAGSDVAICSGKSTTLAASGASTYSWSPATGLSATNIANPTASPASTTTYTVTGTDLNGCQNTASVTISVNSLPVVSAGSDVTICSGQTTNLLASGSNSYSWSPASGLSATNIANPVANPVASTLYTVTGTDNNGCQASAGMNVFVNPLPSVSAGSNVALCSGQSTTLNASGAISYTWSPASGLSATNISNPVANPASTTIYSVTGTDNNGCKATSTVTVSVNTLPLVSAGSDVTLCTGINTTLSASGAKSYSWSPAAGLSATNIANPTASPSITTTYTVIGTDINGCQASANLTVNINALPVVSAGSDVAICNGQNTTLIATGATTYLWSPATGLSSTTISNPVANPASTTTYTVTGTDNNGCKGSASVTLTVNTLPPVNAGSNTAICSGQTTSLNASGATSYIWSPATGLSAINIANPIASPTLSTTYIVTGTDNNGCQANSAVTVSVNSLPLVDAGINAVICNGQSTSLNATGALSYVWSPAAGLSSSNTANPVANPSSTTTYLVTGTNAAGCQGIDSVTVTVNPGPVINAGSDVALCAGKSTNLNASGANSYVWAPGAGLSSNSIANPVASPAATTTYTVTGTDISGCVGSSSITITVNPLPAISAGSDVAFCKGNSATLNASGGISYTWSPSAGLSTATIANPIASPGSSTIYTVTGTDASGCSNTSSVNVTVNPLLGADAGSDVTICAGQNSTLNASGGINYDWTPAAGLSATNIANPVASPSLSTTYFVTVTDINGCQGTDSVLVNVNALSVVATSGNVAICSGQSTNLNASGALTYAWSPAAGLSASNIATPVANPTSTTIYTVTGTAATGCQGSAILTLTVNPLPAISAGNDVAFCRGISAVLNATGGVSYSWSPAAGLSSGSIANPVASPFSTTTYTVSGTDANGCINTSDVLVTVNPLSTADAGKDTTICAGQTVSLSASGGAGYSWTPSIGLSASNISNPNANPGTSTKYFVTVTDINGCQGTDSVFVSVNALPIVSAGTDVTICGSTSTNLLATGAVSYNWSPSIGLSANNIANPVASPVTTSTYVVTGTAASGCQASATVTVNVNSLPSVSAGSDVAFCEGQNTLLSASGANTYSWSPATGLSATNIANTVANPVSTTVYTVTGIDINGCKNTANVTVTVNPLPVITAGADVAICFGNTTTLNASGGTSYAWTPAAGLSTTIGASTIASPATNTLYIVNALDSKGCAGTDSILVTVNYINVKAFSDTTFCLGGSKQLNAVGGQNFSWSPSTGLSNSLIANPIASPIATTKYKVDITDINGCKNSDSVTITVNSLPTASAGNDVAYCEGSSTQLTASGGQTYSWSPATGLSSSSISNPFANPVSTTTYVVTVTNNNGCQDKDSVLVKVNTLPIADAGKDTTFCFGNSVMLQASGGINYQWAPATGLSAGNISNPVAKPAATTTYAVNVTDANNCSGIDSVKVTVTYINITVSADDTLCSGTTSQLNATGGASYSWSPSAGLSNAFVPNPVATPATTTTYSVIVQDLNGCVNQGQVNVKVNAIPAFDAGADLAFCNGKSGLINATGTGSVSWSPAGGLSNTTLLQPVASPAATTRYYGTLTDANGCQNSDSVLVSINYISITKSADTAVCLGSSTQLNVNGGTNYQWTPAAGLSNAAISNPLASPGVNTTYVVQVKDLNGCINTDSIQVSIKSLPIPFAGNDVSICNGNSTSLAATGGLSYLWSPASGLTNTTVANPIASPSVTTDYIVKVTGNNNCSADDTVRVAVTFIAISVSNDTSICAGHTANLTASGGTTYDWSPGATLSDRAVPNPIATPMVATTYKVIVSDINGCTNSDSIRVNVNFIASTISNDTTVCAGASANLKASGGSAYVWSPLIGLSNPNIFNPVAKPASTTKYAVTITDFNGCQSLDTVLVNVNLLPNIVAGNDTSVCNGKSAQLTASGGLSYSWSPSTGLSNTSIANPVALPAVPTKYIVTATDNNGCSNKDSSLVNVTYISITASNDTTICTGQSVQLAAKGGSIYQWSPSTGLSDAAIANPIANPIDSAAYNVTVTDVNGCKNTAIVNVNVHHFPLAFAGNDQSICLGKIAPLTATGGSNYVWSPATGLNNAAIANPEATPSATTQYIVLVSDNIGCTSQDTVNVNVTISVSGTASATPAAFCPGQIIALKATPGAGVPVPAQPYSFDGGATYQSSADYVLPAVSKDTIAYVIIRDLNGCLSDSIQLNLSKKILLGNPSQVSPAACSIVPNGIAKITGTMGGTAPYLYAIDGGTAGTDSVFANLSSGSHSISVQDLAGCSAAFTVTISSQSSILSQITKTDPVCSGDSTAQVMVQASGGSGLGFKFSIDNSKYQVLNTFSNLPEGVHTIVVKDSISCFDTLTVSIFAPDPVVIDVSSTQNILCNGNNTGKISLGAFGGTPNYVYSIGSALFQPSPNFTNLAKGSFTALVKDANGCKDSTTVFLLETDTLSAKIDITQLPTCNGVQGSIQLSNIVGGTPGYLKGIDGKTPGAGNTFTNLLPGAHVVRIVDRNSCARSYDVVMPGDPNSIQGKISIDSITCNTGSNGNIHLLALSGGTRPFQFSLNDQLNFQDDSTFKDLKKGLYTIFAKNANSCLSQFVVNVTEPLPIQTALISQSDITCYGLKDGAISIQAIGGNRGYSYALNPPVFVTSGIFTKLTSGKDTISIKDSKGCLNTYPFEIQQPDSILVQVAELDSAECSVPDGNARITALSGGTGSFKYSLNGGLTYQTDSTFRFLKSGSYDLLVKDASSCTSITSFIIHQKGGGLNIALVKKDITDLSCNNANIGAVALSNLIGGKSPYLFSIDTISSLKTDSSFSGLGAGAHAVHINDGAGCIYDINFVVNQPKPINFQLDIIKTESCDNANGIIAISNVTGGTSNYRYSIDNQPYQDSLIFVKIASGLHNIEVKDGSTGACQSTKPIFMNKKTVPHATITTADPICFGFNNGWMTIDSVKGGEAPYTFSLDGINFQPDSMFANLDADTFSLRIKDSECPDPFVDTEPVFTYGKDSVITDTLYVPYFVLSQPDSITAETFTIVADRSSSGGIFGFYKIKGGNGPYLYSLDSINYQPVTTDTTIIQNLSSGDYYVYLKDSRDCPQEIKIYLGKSLFIPNLITPNGDGQNDYFEVMALRNNSKLTVFNKWGSRVYNNEDYDNSWNGEGLADGVYYYDLQIAAGKKIKGWVQIVR